MWVMPERNVNANDKQELLANPNSNCRLTFNKGGTPGIPLQPLSLVQFNQTLLESCHWFAAWFSCLVLPYYRVQLYNRMSRFAGASKNGMI